MPAKSGKAQAIKSTATASKDAAADNAAAATLPAAAPRPEAPLYVEGIGETEVKAERGTLVSKIKAAFKSAAKITQTMKDIAAEVVTARSMFVYDKGPDWSGKSQAYRTFIGEVYNASGVQKDAEDDAETAKMKSDFHNALRYHISNALRERVPAEELVRAGLKPTTRSERQSAAGVTTSQGVPTVIGGVKVTEPVGALAVATVRAMASMDVVGCVTEALSVLSAARAFGVPEDAGERALLLGKLREVGGLVLAWGHEVETFTPETAVEDKQDGAPSAPQSVMSVA